MNKKVISIIAIIALVAVLGVCLVACGASSYESKLEKAGYTVQTMTDEDIAEMNESTGLDLDIKWGVGGAKGTDYVAVICFADEEQAEAVATFYNMASSILGGMKAETKGAILFFGTEQGIKDAK
jgi:hypothetical protein